MRTIAPATCQAHCDIWTGADDPYLKCDGVGGHPGMHHAVCFGTQYQWQRLGETVKVDGGYWVVGEKCWECRGSGYHTEHRYGMSGEFSCLACGGTGDRFVSDDGGETDE